MNEDEPLKFMDEIQDVITKTIEEQNLSKEDIDKVLDYKRK